jgi:hypothetical protein
VIGVHHQTQGTGTGDAVDLLGELGQGQDHNVWGAQDGARGGRTGHHTDLKASGFSHPGRDRVEDGRWVNTFGTSQHVAIARTTFGECHG